MAKDISVQLKEYLDDLDMKTLSKYFNIPKKLADGNKPHERS